MALIDVGGQRGNPTLSDWFERWHIDSWTLSLLLILSGFGMVMLYSASGHDLGAVSAQAKRLGLGFVLMILVAQAPPEWYRSGAGWLYGGTVLMLVLVLLLGDSAKGAQRWLDFGVMRFQPSELMKLAMPLAIAAYLHQRTLPPQIGSMLVSIVLIAVPTGLVMVQPDLGTSLPGGGGRWLRAVLRRAALALDSGRHRRRGGHRTVLVDAPARLPARPHPHPVQS